jgi:hypothetical protein
MMQQMPGFKELRQQRRMSWIAQQHGWVAVPEEVVGILSNEGFEECKGQTTTSRRDRQPAGGLWQGVDARTGSVASATWVNRPARHYSLVFIEVDGESLADVPERASRAKTPPRGKRDPHQDEGGEGQTLGLPRAKPPAGRGE